MKIERIFAAANEMKILIALLLTAANSGNTGLVETHAEEIEKIAGSIVAEMQTSGIEMWTGKPL